MAEPLDDVIGRLVDGGPVDWPAEEDVSDPTLRALLTQLRVIDRVHESHRTLPETDSIEPMAPAERPRTEADIDPASVPRWGKYRLLDTIGEGSFGHVHRALDEQLQRELAIKLLKPGITARDGFGPRLLREAKDLAKVRHPNVVTIYGVEEHAGQVGLCMEIIEGRTLEAAVRLDGPLNADEAVVVGQAVGRGLAALHQVGLLHRDVKAKNVMRERAGRFVLMDLGASLDTTDPSRMAHARATGTPLYMAPELFKGGASSVQSDVYSLGVLLYFLVTGRHPVEADSYEGLRQAHAAGKRVLLLERRLDLPHAFVTTIDRALAIHPAERFDSLHLLLQGLSADASLSSARTRSSEEPYEPTLRRVVAVLAVIVGLLGLCYGAGFLARWTFNQTLGLSGRVFPSEWLEHVSVGLRALKLPAVSSAIALTLTGLGGAFLEWLSARGKHGSRSRRPGSPEKRLLFVSLSSIVVTIALVAMFGDVVSVLIRTLSSAEPGAFAMFAPDTESGRATLFRVAFSLAFGGLASAWLLAVRRRENEARPAEVVIAASITALLVPGVFLTAPYLLMYESQRPAVSVAGARCFHLGERADEIDVYCPSLPVPRVRRVPRVGGAVVTCGFSESLFVQTPNDCGGLPIRQDGVRP